MTFSAFRSAHAGESILVCGCGESLNLLDHPERFVTIGVNDVGRKFDPTYLVVVNPPQQFTGDRFRFVRESRARVLFTQLELGVEHPAIVKFRLGRYGGTTFADPNVLHYTRNSPYVAVCLAVHMGARRIGLIGVDLTNDHFFGRTGAHALSRRLAQVDREYAQIAEACRAAGVELVNLSPTSRLTSLPRATLDAFGAPAAPAPAAVPPPAPTAEAAGPRPAARPGRRVFFVNYRFLACGDVFSTGLAHAADALGVEHAAASWDDDRLLSRIRAFAPDLVFVVHGRRAAARWGRALRDWRTAVWLLDEPYEVDDTSRWSPAFGTVFVNDPSTLSRHPNAHDLPVCFDPSLHRDVGAPREHLVGFIGGYNPVRERYLVGLAEQGLLSYVVGGPWKAACLKRFAVSPRTTPEETARLYQRTRIVINVFRSVHHFNRSGIDAMSLNPRVFEALACGALVVSEPRPALASTFPDVPTFRTDADLVGTIRGLLADPPQMRRLLDASRARLAGEDYAARLDRALTVTLGDPVQPVPDMAIDIDSDGIGVSVQTAECAAPPDGWQAVGHAIAARDADVISMTAQPGRESGIATTASFEAVKLAFDIRMDARCHFIAKVHAASPADPQANSYHLIATPDRAYVARHHTVLAPLNLARDQWQHVEMLWRGGELSVEIDGRQAVRCLDAVLPSGYCFAGVTAGRAEIRAIGAVAAPVAAPQIDGWSVRGGGTVAVAHDRMLLAGSPERDATLVTDASANDVELECVALIERGAHLIVKIHHQAADDADANSYHLVSTPARSYLARHGHVFADARIPRGVWCRLRLRWRDQCLELFVNGRRVARVADNLLQSGLGVVSVSAGQVHVRGLAVRDLSAMQAPPHIRVESAGTLRPGRDQLPFAKMPRRNLLYHVWPVRGRMWRWNVEQLLSRIDLFNGRRIVGIVHDDRSEHPDEVQKMFDGHGCTFVTARNGTAGEGVTFPVMLDQVRSTDPDEVTFYAHAKGVKYEPSVPEPVSRWARTQYRVALDDWPTVRAQLERYAMTGSFKMLGRFRVHQYLGDWHYSGTFFWLRHAFAFARDLGGLGEFYGCVEAWPGINFRRDETGCLFMDNLRQLPYRDEFWTTANDALARWEATRPPLVPPPTLQTPPPFDGCAVPRLEQHPEEFEWCLGRLTAAAPRTFLCIGSFHGGVEWHVARRFRALGRDIRIVAVDKEGRSELAATLADARQQFGQDIDLVVGDSAAPETRARLGREYDAVFVDGDHGYRGVRRDVEFALTRSPRIVALHDIADSDWHAQAGCCVSRLWSELRERHATEERTVGEWGGIGILNLR